MSPASLKKAGFRILGPGVVGDVDKWGYHLRRAGWVLVYRLDSDVDMEIEIAVSGMMQDLGRWVQALGFSLKISSRAGQASGFVVKRSACWLCSFRVSGSES